MYLYWESGGSVYMYQVTDHTCWGLSVSSDFVYENSVLELEIEGKKYTLDETDGWTEDNSGLTEYIVSKYLYAVVDRVREIVVKEEPKYLDLFELCNEVRSSFWEEWVKAGYIEAE